MTYSCFTRLLHLVVYQLNKIPIRVALWALGPLVTRRRASRESKHSLLAKQRLELERYFMGTHNPFFHQLQFTVTHIHQSTSMLTTNHYTVTSMTKHSFGKAALGAGAISLLKHGHGSDSMGILVRRTTDALRVFPP